MAKPNTVTVYSKAKDSAIDFLIIYTNVGNGCGNNKAHKKSPSYPERASNNMIFKLLSLFSFSFHLVVSNDYDFYTAV